MHDQNTTDSERVNGSSAENASRSNGFANDRATRDGSAVGGFGFRRADDPIEIDPSILADLAKSSLTPADIAIRPESRAGLLRKFGRRTAERLRGGPAYAIIYSGSSYERTKFLDGCPLEEDEPSSAATGTAPKKKRRLPKYKGLVGWSPAPVYFPAGIDWDKVLADPKATIYIVESEKTAALLAKHAFPAVAIGGVNSFTAHKAAFHLLTPDLLRIATPGRTIVVAFDSDKNLKPQVQRAEANLVTALAGRGAVPYTLDIPAPLDGREKNGPDDLIVERGIAAFRELAPQRPGNLVELYSLADTYAYVELQDKLVRIADCHLFTEEHFHRLEAKRKYLLPLVNGGRKELQASREFMKSDLRPSFANVLYYPGRSRVLEDAHINRWSRSYEPVKGDVSKYLRLRDFIFRDSEPGVMHTAECIYAYKYQHPASKLPLALFFFSGTQGTGKSAYVLAAYAAWGSGMLPEDYRNNFRKVSPKELSSNFNSHWAASCEVVLGDELTTQDNYVLDNEIIKDLITRRQMTVEEKHIKAYSAWDFILYSFTSNSPRSLRINSQDRRIFCVHVTEEKPTGRILQDTYEWLFKDPTCGPAMAYYWENFDYGDFNPFDEAGAPWTLAKTEVIRANAGAVEEEIELLLGTERATPEYSEKTKHIPDLSSQVARCDLWSVADFEKHLARRAMEISGSSFQKSPASVNYIREVLKCHGARELPGTIQPPGRPTVRVFAIRNQVKWLAVRAADGGHKACVDEYLVGHLPGQPDKF
jgi:Domain of unknown function (DUF3854)/Family of unknown function (DUF5906)